MNNYPFINNLTEQKYTLWSENEPRQQGEKAVNRKIHL